MKVCTTPGCPNLTDAGKCTTHRKERWRKTNASRPSPAEQGYDATWAKVSKDFRQAFPQCFRCGANAEHTHHRDGKGPRGPQGFDWGNLESLCRSCHNRETGRAHGFGSR